MKTKFKIDYEFNANWSRVTRILVQALVWPGNNGMVADWRTVKSIPYLGESSEEEAKQFLTELEKENSKLI